MIRNPAVAGQFYHNDPVILHDQISALVDSNAKRSDALGVMSPHAGYMYSGKVAGSVMSRVNPADTFIILGPNHTGMGADFSILRDGIWKMPFGEVRVDSILAKEILVNSRVLEIDPMAHQNEHSIEVQIPFLQYFGREFEIVPITIRHYMPDGNFLDICKELGHAIAGVIKNIKNPKMKVTIVASSDLTHYETQESAKRKDKAALDAILEMNPEKLFETINEQEISMCGFGPVAVMLYACRELGRGRSANTELVKYMTSGDITGDYSQVVGYGGVLIHR